MQITQDRDNWSRVPHALLTTVRPAAVVVYAQLAAYAWMPDGARPRIRRLADEVGMSESTVKRCITELEAAGWVTVESRGAEGVQLPNRYHLHLTKQVTSAGGGSTTEPTVGSPVNGGVGSPVTYEEEAVEVEEVREELTLLDTGPPAIPTSVDRDFVDWYEAYPRKVGKQAALTAYRSARKNGATADQLLQGLRRYPFPGRPKNGQPDYRPHPSSWLNKGYWDVQADDDPTATPEQAAAARRAAQGGITWQR